ncbi:Mpv17-like protein [Armadillidium vulgare]|nr:Mpv17-like protein [Armadillidium vulgare]
MNKIKKIFKAYPIMRGVVVYSVLSPTSNATQQFFDPQKDKINKLEVLRFGILGAFAVAPTLYGWLKLAGFIVRGNALKHCVLKAYVEQVIWAPYAYAQFYIGINLLEGKSMEESWNILKEKFWSNLQNDLIL